MPRYVLLLHSLPDGTSHYDLLLERGEVLAAWRIPHSFPQFPPEGVEAEKLKDHRRVYLTYEGEVVGARGTVRRVDEGTYEEAGAWGEDRVRVRLAGREARGTLELSAPTRDSSSWRARFEFGT